MSAPYLARPLDELDAPIDLDLGGEYADELADSALLGRFATTAEVLRFVDEASPEQLASLRGEDVVRALRLDDENLRLRTWHGRRSPSHVLAG